MKLTFTKELNIKEIVEKNAQVDRFLAERLSAALWDASIQLDGNPQQAKEYEKLKQVILNELVEQIKENLKNPNLQKSLEYFQDNFEDPDGNNDIDISQNEYIGGEDILAYDDDDDYYEEEGGIVAY